MEVDATLEFGVGARDVVATVGGGFGVFMGGKGGLFITCHFTRSRVAMESSKDE